MRMSSQKKKVRSMAEQKTVTAREIQQIAATFEEKEKYVAWHGKRIKVTPLLGFAEVFELVSSIMSSCVKSPGDILVAESVDFVFKVKILEKYADIKLPNDIDTQYKIIYGSDICNTVFENINKDQLLVIARIITSYTGITIL